MRIVHCIRVPGPGIQQGIAGIASSTGGHDAHLRYSHMTLVCNYAALPRVQKNAIHCERLLRMLNLKYNVPGIYKR